MKKSIGPRTMAFPTPVWVVGTYDQEGKPNAMTAAWASICCSKPPAIGSLRKATYSYGNIVARQAFTISVPPRPTFGKPTTWAWPPAKT
jgi:flavin reductase (DIM6/NTAB) family NADH-FMN oxidoreductase RutF